MSKPGQKNTEGGTTGSHIDTQENAQTSIENTSNASPPPSLIKKEPEKPVSFTSKYGLGGQGSPEN